MLWDKNHLCDKDRESMLCQVLLQAKIYRGYTKVPYYRSSADTSYAMVDGKRQAQ